MEPRGTGVGTRADTVEGLGDLLGRHGVEPATWYGVRLLTDRWRRDPPVADVPAGALTDVLAVGLEASRRHPYRQLSRLFHLVGLRRGGAGGWPGPPTTRWGSSPAAVPRRQARVVLTGST